MSLPSVMKHNFARIPRAEINRSKFDRSHGLKTAFDSGYLVPIECQEVYPGDEVDYTTKTLLRMAPVVTCPMDNVFLDIQAFFVPDRLIWTNFTKMMGERVNPRDSIDYLVPQINSGETGFEVGSLADYFGIPPSVPNLDVSALPFRAYQKVWDDWYRDENLQDSMIQSSADLDDQGGQVEWTKLQKRGKRHDYFTSCLSAPQKGAGVELPLGAYAPVVGNGQPISFGTGNSGEGAANQVQFATREGKIEVQLSSGWTRGVIPQTAGAEVVPTNNNLLAVALDPNYSGLVCDLSNATAATINSLRLAFQVQRLLERDNRSGTRYTELLRSHFLTVSPDARLQRSEYLGGASNMVAFNPVLQTSASLSGETPQGNLTANPKGQTELKFKKAFTEHGWLLIIANVRCDLNYQQGLPRQFSRKSRYDFYWPALANLGEMAVLNKEIYAQGASVTNAQGQIVDDLPFGYQEAWADLRYCPSLITGKMRSTASGSLDIWHLAQKFDQLPTLSAEWIEDTPPLDRIIAVSGEPQILLDCYHFAYWSRPLPTYSVPGLIDHN